MKDHIYNEQNGLHYTLHGDVYLPDLNLPAAHFAAMTGCFFAYRIEKGYGLRYNEFDESGSGGKNDAD